MDLILAIIIAIVCLLIGGAAGYMMFLHVIKGKYNEMMETAQKEADVIKDKKMLEVKEKFINKKAELEKEVQARNQKLQQSENKLKQRETSLNQKQEELGKRKQEIEQSQKRIENEKKLLALKQDARNSRNSRGSAQRRPKGDWWKASRTRHGPMPPAM